MVSSPFFCINLVIYDFRGVKNEETYQKARVDIKQKVLNYEGPRLAEQMQTTIRNYIVKEKEDKGSFPDIPDEEDGGSKFIFFPPDANEENAESESGKVHNLWFIKVFLKY